MSIALGTGMSFGRVYKSERAAANYAASVQGHDREWIEDMIVFVHAVEGGYAAFVIEL